MKNLVLFYAVLLVLFVSCQNEVIDPSVSTESFDEIDILIPSTAKLIAEKSVIYYPEGEVSDAASFAQLLASAVPDKSVRSFIKEESNKKFDGDYNFLVNKTLETKVGSLTFKEKISRLNKNTHLKSTNVFESVLQNEKLQVSVPVLIDKWDVNKHELLVAVAVGVVDGETDYVYAYDSKGRAYLLDAKVEPDVPVIVIGNNERTGADPDSETNEKAARVSGQYEHMGYLKCFDLGEIESWLKGGPEFRVDCVIYDGGSKYDACDKMLYPSRSSASDGYDPDRNLFQWYFATSHGPNYYFKIWEIDDAGTTHTFQAKFNVPGGREVSYSLSYKSLDRELVGEVINYETEKPQYIEDDLMRIKLE
jgi:hypothetical protein